MDGAFLLFARTMFKIIYKLNFIDMRLNQNEQEINPKSTEMFRRVKERHSIVDHRSKKFNFTSKNK